MLGAWQVGEKREERLWAVVDVSERGYATVHGIYTQESYALRRKQTALAAGLGTEKSIQIINMDSDVWPDGNIDCY